MQKIDGITSFTTNIQQYTITMSNITEYAKREWTTRLFKFIFHHCRNFHHASHSPYITMDFVLSHLDKGWNWGAICKNPNITMNDIELHITLFNENVTKETHFMYPNDFPCAIYISYNPNLTMEFIKSHPSKYWDWDEISSLPLATMETILRFPARKWNWFVLSSNPSITMQNILDYPNAYPWSYQNVENNPNFTTDVFNKNPNENLRLYFRDMSKNAKKHTKCSNRYCSMDFIAKRPRNTWDWNTISKNPNLTLDFIAKHPDIKWDWENICKNPLDNDRNNYIDTITKQILLTAMCEWLCDENNYANDVMNFTKIEYVLADDFLVSLLAKY